MSAPNKSERQICWDSRDRLWKCLDDNEDNQSKCQKFRQDFEANCSKQWVKYFMKRRDYLKYRNKIETEGFDPVDEESKS